jgi:hypothetical protein
MGNKNILSDTRVEEIAASFLESKRDMRVEGMTAKQQVIEGVRERGIKFNLGAKEAVYRTAKDLEITPKEAFEFVRLIMIELINETYASPA